MRAQRQRRVDAARQQFKPAAILAAQNKLILRQCSAVHYQLKCSNPEWTINIYPSTQRLYNDRQLPGPFLDFDDVAFDLVDIVQAGIQARDRPPKKRSASKLDADWSVGCSNCGAIPIVKETGLCGPCTFGEADTTGDKF